MWMAHLGMLNQGSAKHVAEIRRIVVHEYYNARNFDYDIALLQLKKVWPSGLEQYIQPVCLPAPSQTFTEGHRCWVTGWGYRSEQGNKLKINEKLCAPLFISFVLFSNTSAFSKTYSTNVFFNILCKLH